MRHALCRAFIRRIDRIGRNTPYIIHAEEILASNYAQMVTGETPQSPGIHARMREVMVAPAR